MGESGTAESRAARNEALFREVNEKIEGLNKSVEDYGTPAWVCECADPTCVEQFLMTIAEYEALRSHAERFAIVPDPAHLRPDAEVVVARTTDYWIVEKLGVSAEIAETLDPRDD
jgi:hypothetical protein